jgi:hypothetical protein
MIVKIDCICAKTSVNTGFHVKIAVCRHSLTWPATDTDDSPLSLAPGTINIKIFSGVVFVTAAKKQAFSLVAFGPEIRRVVVA